MILPGQVFRPSADVSDSLGRKLGNMVTDLEDDYREYFTAIAAWWKWYEAEPRTKERDFPFRGASNIVVPLIQISCDSLVSRAMASIFGAGRRVWHVSSENEGEEQHGVDMARFLNWAANGNDFDYKVATHDFLLELYVLGSAVKAINYRQDLRPMFFGAGGRNPQHQMIEVRRGVDFTHIPREQILWDTRTSIGDSSFVVREHAWTWQELKMMAQVDDSWDMDAVVEVKSAAVDHSGASKKVRDAKRRLDLRTANAFRENEERDIREIHVDWPIANSMGFEIDEDPDPKVPNLPIVAYMDRATSKVLRLTAEPYHLTRKPFFDAYFRKRTGRGHSVGVAKKLQHFQLMMSTRFNQSVDAQTRANAMWSITRNPKFLKEPLDPSKPIYAQGMRDEFDLLQVATNPGPDLSLMQAGQVIAERVTGQSDPVLGRESRSGGHPSPATSTLALLEQGNIVSADTDILLRNTITAEGRAALVLYQQFETDSDGRLNRTFGEEDGKRIKEVLFPTGPIEQGFTLDVVAMSPHLNPEAEMQRAVTIAQLNTNYWIWVQRGVQMLENPQIGPMLKGAWIKSIQAQTKVYQRALAANDVDEMELFLARLNEFGAAAQEAIGEFSQGVGGAAPAGGAVQGPGNGRLVGGDAEGAGVPPEGLGVLQ